MSSIQEQGEILTGQEAKARASLGSGLWSLLSLPFPRGLFLGVRSDRAWGPVPVPVPWGRRENLSLKKCLENSGVVCSCDLGRIWQSRQLPLSNSKGQRFCVDNMTNILPPSQKIQLQDFYKSN